MDIYDLSQCLAKGPCAGRNKMIAYSIHNICLQVLWLTKSWVTVYCPLNLHDIRQ